MKQQTLLGVLSVVLGINAGACGDDTSGFEQGQSTGSAETSANAPGPASSASATSTTSTNGSAASAGPATEASEPNSGQPSDVSEGEPVRPGGRPSNDASAPPFADWEADAGSRSPEFGSTEDWGGFGDAGARPGRPMPDGGTNPRSPRGDGGVARPGLGDAGGFPGGGFGGGFGGN